MRGLALEGGGARGAYHIGAVKALIEAGYEFDGFVGTSIGAVNAAILAQGDFEKALELWQSISLDRLFDEEEQRLLRMLIKKTLKIDKELPSDVRKALSKIIGGRGINTEKISSFLRQYIDEDVIRASSKDFGLVTVSLSERKPYELMLEDIPHGKLVDYIMASSTLPGFRVTTIDDRKFVDGGFYNNCPANLLINRGYDEIIAIRISITGIVPRGSLDGENIKIIERRGSLGNILHFSPENSETNIKLGYYDGLRFAHNLRGSVYYIRPVDNDRINAGLMTLDDSIVREIGRMLDIPDMPPKRMLFEKIIPRLGTYLRIGKNFDYADLIIALLEEKAKQKEIERFCVYDYDELRALAAGSPSNAKNNAKGLSIKLPINQSAAKKKAAIEILTNSLL